MHVIKMTGCGISDTNIHVKILKETKLFGQGLSK